VERNFKNLGTLSPLGRYNQYPRNLLPDYNRRSFPLTSQNLGIAKMIGAAECSIARVDFAGITEIFGSGLQ
jgi:hypothetical protein